MAETTNAKKKANAAPRVRVRGIFVCRRLETLRFTCRSCCCVSLVQAVVAVFPVKGKTGKIVRRTKNGKNCCDSQPATSATRCCCGKRVVLMIVAWCGGVFGKCVATATDNRRGALRHQLRTRKEHRATCWRARCTLHD